MNHAGARSEQIAARRLQGGEVKCGTLLLVLFYGGHSPLFLVKYVLKYYEIDLTIARKEPVNYPSAAPPKVSNLAQND
jgi:hypothetical protein